MQTGLSLFWSTFFQRESNDHTADRPTDRASTFDVLESMHAGIKFVNQNEQYQPIDVPSLDISLAARFLLEQKFLELCRTTPSPDPPTAVYTASAGLFAHLFPYSLSNLATP